MKLPEYRMTSRCGGFQDLLRRVARLRDPVDGCPWDRAQDHRSLRAYLLEEAYETIAAIDAGESQALCDELGDVLLQVVLHAQIASESGSFDMQDVVQGLDEKLLRRHPHVFGNAPDNGVNSIRKRWSAIKATEERPKHSLPTLLEARKLISEQGLLDTALAQTSTTDTETEAGMRILSTLALCWDEGIEPELALRKAVAAVRAHSAGAAS